MLSRGQLQLFLSANLTSKKLAENELTLSCNFSQNSDVIERLVNFSEVDFLLQEVDRADFETGCLKATCTQSLSNLSACCSESSLYISIHAKSELDLLAVAMHQEYKISRTYN